MKENFSAIWVPEEAFLLKALILKWFFKSQILPKA
jgi:hypothetical protein